MLSFVLEQASLVRLQFSAEPAKLRVTLSQGRTLKKMSPALLFYTFLTCQVTLDREGRRDVKN